MAYVSGRLAGKHKIWPKVSPNKTWEGSIGGAAFTIGLALIFSGHFSELSTGEWVIFASIAVVFGSLGGVSQGCGPAFILTRGGGQKRDESARVPHLFLGSGHGCVAAGQRCGQLPVHVSSI